MAKRRKKGKSKGGPKKQQNKMKAAAKKWRSYKQKHPSASYITFMKRELKK